MGRGPGKSEASTRINLCFDYGLRSRAFKLMIVRMSSASAGARI